MAGPSLESTVSGRDTNFYYSFLVLPRVKREAIVAVWDFCRAVDDAVDEAEAAAPKAIRERPGAIPSAQLERWREELARCYDGQQPSTPQGRRLQPFIAAFGLPRQAFEDLIDGVEMDLSHVRYATFESLRQYCLRVASAVGLICVEIFGYRNVHARDYAIDLGIALQLTNIIRDISADLKRGRLYIPLEDLKRFGCCEEDLQAGIVTENVAALLRHQCDRAREFYRKADRLLPPRDGRHLAAARIMGAIYFELLLAIERSNYDVFSRVIRVTRPRRAVIAAVTWVKTMAGIRR